MLQVCLCSLLTLHTSITEIYIIIEQKFYSIIVYISSVVFALIPKQVIYSICVNPCLSAQTTERTSCGLSTKTVNPFIAQGFHVKQQYLLTLVMAVNDHFDHNCDIGLARQDHRMEELSDTPRVGVAPQPHAPTSHTLRQQVTEQ